PIARLERIEAAEAVLIPAEHHLEIAPFLGVAQQLLEGDTLLCGIAADTLVLVFPKDPIRVFGGVGLDFHTLVWDAGLLPIIRHAVVSHGRDRSRHGKGLLQGKTEGKACVPARPRVCSRSLASLHPLLYAYKNTRQGVRELFLSGLARDPTLGTLWEKVRKQMDIPQEDLPLVARRLKE